MRKCLRSIGACLLLAALVWTGTLIADRRTLRRELVRLHIVAASDSQEDQALKLRVRDAVASSLQQDLACVRDADTAKEYLREKLPTIEHLVNSVLQQAGCDDTASVSLAAESFAARVYDTFTLPAGVYDALRITIGAGEGKNWWCVVFPNLCLPATSEGFEEAADCAGFPETLTAALEKREGYEARFFLLDALGRLENLLCGA